jgi:transposase-like protein
MVKSSKINRQQLQWVLEQPIEIKLNILSNHLDICKVVMNSILHTAVNELCGERYKHDGNNYTRWGYNPGSVSIGAQKIPIEVPRVCDTDTGKAEPLKIYEQLRELPEQNEELLQTVLHGISMRDYEGVCTRLLDSFGLSATNISRQFVEASKEAVEKFCQRSFSDQTFVALFIDGKYLAGQQMIIALGITNKGKKVFLSVIQSTTENSIAIKQMLSDLIQRGFKFKEGLFCVIDGSKGIYKALKEVWAENALVQRCQWHKRENVVSYLNEALQVEYRKKLQQAYQIPDYKEAKSRLIEISSELKSINLNSYNSLMEGLEETLTLHQLGLREALGKSFTTTNCIESVNSHLVKYIHKVKHWMDSEQRHRWVVSGLMEIEGKLTKVKGYRQLNRLSDSIASYIKNKKSKNRISTKNET